MKEAEVEKHFYEYTNQLVRKLGKHPLDNLELDKMGHSLFGNKYNGTYSQNTVPYKNGFSITNVDIQSEPGSHWVALYQTHKTLYVFDSYGRATSKLLPILTRKAKRLGLKLVMSDPDRNQSDSSVICGHLAVAFLMCVKNFGIKNALKI